MLTAHKHVQEQRPLFGTTGWRFDLHERAESEKSYTREPWPEDRQQQPVRCPEFSAGCQDGRVEVLSS